MSLAVTWSKFLRTPKFQVLEKYFYYLTAREFQDLGLEEFMIDVDNEHKAKMLKFFQIAGVKAFVDHVSRLHYRVDIPSPKINYVLITDNVIRFPSGTENLKLTYDDVKFVFTAGQSPSASYPRTIVVGLEFHDGHVARLVEMINNLQPIFWREFQPWVSLEKTQMSLDRHDTSHPVDSPGYLQFWADLVQLLRLAIVSIVDCNYVMKASFLYYLHCHGVLDKLQWYNPRKDDPGLRQELEKNYPEEICRIMEREVMNAHD